MTKFYLFIYITTKIEIKVIIMIINWIIHWNISWKSYLISTITYKNNLIVKKMLFYYY